MLLAEPTPAERPYNSRHGLVSLAGFPMAFRSHGGRAQPDHCALAISACARRNLFLRILFSRLSNPGIDWPTRNFTRRALPSGCFAITRILAALVVRANPALDLQRVRDAQRSLLGRDACVDTAAPESVAPRDAGNLLSLFSLVHQRGTRVFKLPIRRHVTGSRFHFTILRAAGASPGSARNMSSPRHTHFCQR